jgi:phosphoglycolate phosphatase-like HAD superfamily hydrolase
MHKIVHQSGVRNIFILDIDGTLMPSNVIDNECFWRAVDEVIGGAGTGPDLHGFEHVTDAGILLEWMQREHGRSASRQEEKEIKQRFLDQLILAAHRRPQWFTPLPGLMKWLRSCREKRDSNLAIATGGWAHSARFKLEFAGLDEFDLPLASSDDAVSRTNIMQIALQRSLGSPIEQGHSSDASITYFGDGIWDYTASRALGWRFIGIASGSQAERLSRAGAGEIYEDFTELLQSTRETAS